MIDFWLNIFGGSVAYDNIVTRIFAFCIGMIATAAAIAFFFRTDLPLQMYELVVVEVATKYNIDKNKAKTTNDAIMLLISLLFAVFINHNMKGIGIGTIIITILNSPLIKFFGLIYDKIFTFEPTFKKLNSLIKK